MVLMSLLWATVLRSVSIADHVLGGSWNWDFVKPAQGLQVLPRRTRHLSILQTTFGCFTSFISSSARRHIAGQDEPQIQRDSGDLHPLP